MASIIKADTLQSTTANVFVLNSSGTEYARFDSTGVFQLTNPTTFPAGTALLPSITATGDTNTGLYFPAADTIGFVEGGVEAMRIDSDGDVGIGTTTPGKKLDILSNTSQDGIRISGSTNPRLTIIDTTTPVQFDALCTDTEAVLRTDTNHPLVLSSNGTERMRIPAAGGVQAVTTISVGNATPSTSGAGITFPATQSASTDANTLDDYEEGTFTPTITGSSTNPSYTASLAAGKYTKIGRIVHFNFLIIITVVASQGTGNIQISGFPFASTGNGYEHVVKIGYNDIWETAFLSGYIGGTTMNIIPTGVTQSNAGFGSAGPANSPISTGYFAVSGTYQT
jgi:hypothetical protein